MFAALVISNECALVQCSPTYKVAKRVPMCTTSSACVLSSLVQPLISIPNLATSVHRLSYANKMHIKPEWASSKVFVSCGGLRNQLRCFIPPFTRTLMPWEYLGSFSHHLYVSKSECMEFAGITQFFFFFKMMQNKVY